MAQVAAVFGGLGAIYQPVESVIRELVNLGHQIGFDNDHAGRERFVKNLLERGRTGYPNHYIMVVNCASNYHPATRDNAADFVVKMGQGGAYRVIIFKHGKFDLYSDGGWINWGFTGGKRSGDGGKHVEW